MSRRLAAALAVTALGLGAPAARAAEPSSSYGSCHFSAVSQESVTGADRFAGVAYAYIALYSTSGAVVSADVTCELKVDGEVQDTVSGSGTGVATAAGRIEYVANDSQTVYLCTTVDYTSDDTPTKVTCWWLGWFPGPGEWELVETAWAAIEQRTCNATGGDVYVAEQWVWDCPPYGV